MNKILQDAKSKAEDNLKKINEKILQAEKERNDLDAQLNINDPIEKYSAVCLKKNTYNEYINGLKEEQTRIKNNMYSPEVIEAAKSSIQKEYNKRLKKAYDEMVKAFNNAIEQYNKYNEEYTQFVEERTEFNNVSNGESLYDGDDAIQYEGTKVFDEHIKRLETVFTNWKDRTVSSNIIYKQGEI